MARKGGKGIYAVTLGLFLLGVGYLMVVGFSENSMPFIDVSKALALPAAELRPARLFGTVKGEGLSRMEDRLGVTFQLGDKDNVEKTLWVVYEGAVPDTFKAGAEVIVEGSLHEGETVFRAESLMTKCPSKYQRENRG